MTKMDKQINAIISRIEWPLVSFCIISESTQKYNNMEEIIVIEKEKLIKRLRFIVLTKMDELVCNFWIIKYNKNDEILQLYFTPIFIISILGTNEKPIKKQTDFLNIEFKTLHEMLEKARNEENYELCHIIKNRLEEIIKEMPSKTV